MTTILEVAGPAAPALASFPSPPQGVWHLGWLPIRAYALFIIIGIVVALIIGDRRWAARGGEPGVIYDIALWAVPFGLVGGRLYHVMTDWKTYFGDDGAGFVAALKIWDGGLGIWGAVALGGVGAWIGCRRRGIPLPAFGDAIAPGIILAQAIGRLGNYFNQELYGRPTTMPWGLEIFDRRDPSGLIDPHSLDGVSTGHVVAVVQPTFLYELLWNVLVFVALIYIDRWLKLGHGRLFATYVAGYCIGRFWVELLRNDTATHIAGIRINSFTSTFVFIAAVVYIVLAPKGREDPASLVGKPRERDKDEAQDTVEAGPAEPAEPKGPVKAEDSALMEWTKELAAVASTTGVVAGVAVAAAADEDSAEGEDAAAKEPEESTETAEELTPDVESDGEESEPEAAAALEASSDDDEAESGVEETAPEASAAASSSDDDEVEEVEAEDDAESHGEGSEPEADADEAEEVNAEDEAEEDSEETEREVAAEEESAEDEAEEDGEEAEPEVPAADAEEVDAEDQAESHGEKTEPEAAPEEEGAEYEAESDGEEAEPEAATAASSDDDDAEEISEGTKADAGTAPHWSELVKTSAPAEPGTGRRSLMSRFRRRRN